MTFFEVCAAWASVAGLVIGVVGLVFTVWTYRKARSIEKTLREAENKHLLSVRASDYIKQLGRISKKLTELPKRSADLQPDLTLLLSETREVCRSIREKLEELSSSDQSRKEWQLPSLAELEDHIEIMFSNPVEAYAEEIRRIQLLLRFVSSLQIGIELTVKDRKGRI